MTVTFLSTKGQIVIPKWIREVLKLKPGAKFTVELEGEKIILSPAKQNIAEELYGKYRNVDLLEDLAREHQKELNYLGPGKQ